MAYVCRFKGVASSVASGNASQVLVEAITVGVARSARPTRSSVAKVTVAIFVRIAKSYPPKKEQLAASLTIFFGA